MTNADLILLLGIGLAAVALALIVPAFPRTNPAGEPRSVWIAPVLGVAGAVAGLVAVLVVATR